MLLSFKTLKTQTIIEHEVSDEATVDDLIQLARQLFDIGDESVIKLIVGNTLLTNTKPLAQQKVVDGTSIIVNFRAAKRVEPENIEVPGASAQTSNAADKRVSSATEEESPDAWYPQTYSEYLNRDSTIESADDNSTQDAGALLRLDRSRFPFKYYSYENMYHAEQFTLQLSNDQARLEQLFTDPQKLAALNAFCGGRNRTGNEQISADEVLALGLQSMQMFGHNVEDEDDKAYEERQLNMLREMGELDSQFPQVNDVPVQQADMDYTALRERYGEQLQQIKDMGVTLGDEEILQLLELAGGNVEVVINQIFEQ